jgi:hypothetical protein
VDFLLQWIFFAPFAAFVCALCRGAPFLAFFARSGIDVYPAPFAS